MRRLADLRGAPTRGEPILDDVDRARWRSWRLECLAYSETARHAARVDRSRRTVAEFAAAQPGAVVSWSGGKDSTAVAHLVTVECGVSAELVSVKDDLDFPGEEAYVVALAKTWGAELTIERPDISLQAWLGEHADELDHADGDLHGRSAGLSAEGFYAVLERAWLARGRPGAYLGIRAEESRGRRLNRATRGLIYEAGGWPRCQPIADWSARDVFGYLFARGIPVHDVYRCARFHSDPGRIRKSWWAPGAHGRSGGLQWLRWYWPSLARRLAELLPTTDHIGR